MESIEQKQQYLCQHIIEGGYDADEFTHYCERVMGGIDIAGWTFSDLEHIVKSFVEEKRSGSLPVQGKQEGGGKPNEGKESNRVDTSSSECPPTPSTNTHTFRKEDLDHLFSLTFSSRTQYPRPAASNFTGQLLQNLKPGEPLAGGVGNTGQASNSTTKYSFDDIFKGIERPSAPTSKSQINPNAQSKQVGSLNIFDTEHDEAAGSYTSEVNHPPLRSTLPSKVEEAVLKKPKHHESPKRPEAPKSKLTLREPKKELVKCKKAPQRPFLSKPLEVEVRGHEIVNRNFFVPDYVLYHVFTRGINVEVKRKYDHFQRLRTILAKLYPCCRLPYLEKNTWLSETDIEFIKKQKSMLQSFMNDLLMNRQIKNSRVLEQFLTITEHTKVKSLLTEYETLPKLKSLDELSLLVGEVQLEHSERAKDYVEKMVPYLTGLSENIGRFLKLSEQLSINYSALVKTFTEVNQLVSVMAQSTQQLHQQLQQPEVASSMQLQIQQLHRSLLTVGTVYEELSNNAKFEQRLVETHLRPLLRFEKENVLTITELIEMRTKMADQLTRQQQQKQPQKEATSTRNLEPPKTSIDEPSKFLSTLRQQAAFYNQVCLTECNRLLGDLAIKLRNRFRQLTGQYKERWASQLPLFQQLSST